LVEGEIEPAAIGLAAHHGHLMAPGDERLRELVGSGARRAVWGGEVLVEVEDVQGLQIERKIKNEERKG
jgi:hypothetical protein